MPGTGRMGQKSQMEQMGARPKQASKTGRGGAPAKKVPAASPSQDSDTATNRREKGMPHCDPRPPQKMASAKNGMSMSLVGVATASASRASATMWTSETMA